MSIVGEEIIHVEEIVGEVDVVHDHEIVPQDLLHEILVKSEVESIVRFKCVKKMWRNMINSPIFIKSHIECENRSSIRLIIRNDHGKVYSTSLDSWKYWNEELPSVFQAKHLFTPSGFGVPRIPELPVSVCHGMLLIPVRENNAEILWNPFLHEFVDLPPLPESRASYKSNGIGYREDVGDYNVVRIFNQHAKGVYFLRTSVYSRNSGTWKSIPNFEGCHVSSPSGVFANGAIHWLGELKHGGNPVVSLIVLNLQSECFTTLPLTPYNDVPERRRLQEGGLNLDVLSGVLFMSFRSDQGKIHTFHLFMMKQYGSWSKVISLTSSSDSHYMRPMGYWKYENQILTFHESKGGIGEFFLYDIGNGLVKKIIVNGTPAQPCSCQVIQASLVRPKIIHATGSTSAATNSASQTSRSTSAPKKKWKRGNDRLNLSITVTDVGDDIEVGHGDH